jgi:hypothetical protein
MLTAFGIASVVAMLVLYGLERRHRWAVLGFGISCLAGSAYGFLQGAWPFGVAEIIWAAIAFNRWHKTAP